MFYDDILLVKEKIEEYGLVKPMVDLGGLERPSILGYEPVKKVGVYQQQRLTIRGRPFDFIDPEYLIFNPVKGAYPIEELPHHYREYFGTVLCLSVLEHVRNPFEVFDAFESILRPDGLVIVSTVFAFPYHPSPLDFWRFTPDCLEHLGETAGLKVLEKGWRVNVQVPQTHSSVCCVLCKDLQKRLQTPRQVYAMPEVELWTFRRIGLVRRLARGRLGRLLRKALA